MARIDQFNVNHVRTQARRIAKHPLTTWSDGTYIVVSAGEGPDGKAVAAKILAHTALPACVHTSALLGSIADREAKAARGIHDQAFVLIARNWEAIDAMKCDRRQTQRRRRR